MKTLLEMELYYVREYTPTCRFIYIYIFQGLSSVPNVHLWSVWFVIICGWLFFVLGEYILKVLVSSEHKLYQKDVCR
jgi:H+/Cl- antiporter ClcA